MRIVEKAGLAALRLVDPETAHGLALRALNLGLAGRPGPVRTGRLAIRIAGIDLPNPVGIAAGFDKNAQAVDATLAAGPGFVEIGAVTPRPQAGNPKPRLFRLAEDQAAINRFGFNNLGMEAVYTNLARHRRRGVVGVNLGANKDTEDKAEDYIAVLKRFHDLVDFATVNVSSPNTERLRDLQGRAALETLLARVLEARDALPARVPVFLKIAPDLTARELTDIAETCIALGLDAIVATNTTTERAGLSSPLRDQTGGLSGAPLFERSTEVLRTLNGITHGQIPLIGVGGVASAAQAYAKIRAGAAAVQLYTGLVYGGIGLAARIARGLDALVARDGHARLADAVGAAG